MSARTDSIGSRIRSTGFNVVLGDETRFKFSIFTDEKGYNSGVTYTMSVSDENQCLEMVKEIEALRSIERARIERVNDGSRVKWAQRAVRRCYATRLVQWGFAALIFANFVLNVAQTELQPADGSALQGAFERCDTAFKPSCARPVPLRRRRRAKRRARRRVSPSRGGGTGISES